MMEKSGSDTRWLYAAMLIGMTGCTPPLYDWGGFEQGIYERYVNEQSAQADVYLLDNINHAEQNHLKVPPGAYADYGYVLFKRGDRDGAVAYFEREKQAFPESTALMNKLIARIKPEPADKTRPQSTPDTTADGSKP